MAESNNRHLTRTGIFLAVWAVLAGVAFGLDAAFPGLWQLPGMGGAKHGEPAFRLVGIVAGLVALFELFILGNQLLLVRKRKPAAEGRMVGKLYRLAAALVVVLAVAYGFGVLGAFGTAFAAFGGMLLGWSLQAPVSGFAAWVLVSLKRPFRPGDRIQFPNLGLTGDVQDIGLMYTTLDQVGGSIGSEEAVGRHILVPNAMLFSQVVINYTVTQEAAYMLDEAVIRITFDSDWEAAEKILLDAAREITGDIIAVTGTEAYIRSDLYDYGIYLRLRYQTRVKDRVELSYLIQKKIFEAVRRTTTVDMAIPFIYSYRAGLERKESDAAAADAAAAVAADAAAARASLPPDKEASKIQQVKLEQVHMGDVTVELPDVEQVAESIAAHGLLQPIMVVKKPGGDIYDVLAGHLRVAACRKLGWKTIPAVVLDSTHGPTPAPPSVSGRAPKP
ncbi:MAG: ParB N-terminal domain-containing protein [Planctomycetota bacterium]